MIKLRIEPYVMWSRYAAKATDQLIRNVKRINCRTFLLSMFYAKLAQEEGAHTHGALHARHNIRFAVLCLDLFKYAESVG